MALGVRTHQTGLKQLERVKGQLSEEDKIGGWTGHGDNTADEKTAAELLLHEKQLGEATVQRPVVFGWPTPLDSTLIRLVPLDLAVIDRLTGC